MSSRKRKGHKEHRPSVLDLVPALAPALVPASTPRPAPGPDLFLAQAARVKMLLLGRLRRRELRNNMSVWTVAKLLLR